MALTLKFSGCKKDDPSTDNSRDIYIAGFDNGYIAYWKNDTEYKLSATQASAVLQMELPYQELMYM